MNAMKLFTLAARHHQSGELEIAIALYRQALENDPPYAEAALYLGMALFQMHHLPEALTAYRLATRLMPEETEAWNGLGNVCLAQGNYLEALRWHKHALKIEPTSATAMDGLGSVFLATGNQPLALDWFQKALEAAPPTPETLNNLGVTLKAAKRPKEAIATLEKALELDPSSLDTLYNLGNAWQARGDMQLAHHYFSSAHALAPAAIAPLWGGCFAHLDMFYNSEDAVRRSRNAYAQALTELDKRLTLDSPEQIREAAAMVGANQPFYLTYQGKNDRDLQRQYGALVSRIMATAFPHYTQRAETRKISGKIRVGIATGFMCEHSVWKIPTRGWVHHLDRRKFDVFGYYTGIKNDRCTEEAKALLQGLTHESGNFEKLCQSIVEDQLDVLIYPDIGMDPTCAKLAGLRLAPVQCVSLGHPMTTGLPTMDVFLSNELMEPADGKSNYTEELVQLPHIGIHYTPLRHGPPEFKRASFGLPDDALLYFCPQSLYKYLPQYDRLYPLIAERVPDCRFVFLQDAQADVLNRRFLERMTRTFAEFGLDATHSLVMLPHQAPKAYHALNCLCNVFLDSIEWSGFNTAMEAANCGLPIITWPQGLMRGRHTAGVLSMLDIPEAKADSFEAYVDLAVRCGTDAAFRARLRGQIQKNRLRLFEDHEAIRGLEDFLEQRVRYGDC
ncbi:putative TPR domain protein [Pseudodesulfovibrio piezophilus C1TLV30]|uniref:protein O-GlcNAc transferase n=2 Tax=Pseudodesulfovibrio TaxID=2035811 RepID=M1WXR5_PSEP2|nr:putative TPR domain protein [Pseudodesulfovibrio piezophilus C1TLV30]